MRMARSRSDSIRFSVCSENIDLPSFNIDESPSNINEKETQSNVSSKTDKANTTCWKSIYLMTAISCFSGVQFSVFFTSLWPYLNTVDRTAGVTFFGIITAVFSAGQAIGSPAFGYWSNKVKSVKYPLIFGVSVMIGGNFVYCFTESFDESNRKWLILAARAFVGCGTGIIGLMKAYGAMASVLEDRSRAIVFVTGFYVLGLTIGPGIQVALSPIGYPGVIYGFFHLDMYTAPAWFATVVNVISLLLIIVIFEERYAGIIDEATRKDRYFALPKFDKLAASVCIGTQFTLMLIITNLETIGSMYSMAMWNWNDEQVIRNSGLIQIAHGIFSILVYMAFSTRIGPLLCNGTRERFGTLFGLFVGLLFHVITYPYDFWSEKLDYKTVPINGTVVVAIGNWSAQSIDNESGGCELYYSWCTDAHRVPLWLYVLAYVFCLSVAITTINVCMSTLYSKILGPRRQGTMQGMLLLSGSIARTLGPMLVASSFEKFGPSVVWTLEIVVIVMTLIVWLLFLPRMIPLDPQPQLPVGHGYRYKNGTKYRF